MVKQTYTTVSNIQIFIDFHPRDKNLPHWLLPALIYIFIEFYWKGKNHSDWPLQATSNPMKFHPTDTIHNLCFKLRNWSWSFFNENFMNVDCDCHIALLFFMDKFIVNRTVMKWHLNSSNIKNTHTQTKHRITVIPWLNTTTKRNDDF